MYALMISAFIRRELQLSFYANETTSPVHGRPCIEGEHSIDFYPQCFNNPETVTSTVESVHDETNTMTCAASRLILSAREFAKSDQSSSSIRRKFGSVVTHKAHGEDSDQTGWMLSLSGNSDHLHVVDFCHAPAYSRFPLTIINTLSFHRKAADHFYTKRFAMLPIKQQRRH